MYQSITTIIRQPWAALLLVDIVFAVLLATQSSSSSSSSLSSQTGDNYSKAFATSGARSVNPLSGIVSLGESFNLLNLFNVFRGQQQQQPPSTAVLGSQTLESAADNLIQVDANDELALNGLTNQNWAQTIKGKFNSLTTSATSTISSTNNNANIPQSASPVILVPGYGGSRLEAKLNKPAVVRYFCDQKSDWTDIWVNVKLLLPYMIDCLIDDMRLEFDYSTNRTKNTAGVEVRVKNESQVLSVEYLHDLPFSSFAYFALISERLIQANLGYKRELNIIGAPYDFRKAPNELDDYFSKLKETIERTHMKNGLKPISLICHSMGCNNMLYFLHRQTQNWKQIHIKRLISIAAPWAGSLSAVRAAALGDDLGLPYLFSESKLILVQRSLPSTIYLFPNKIEFSDIPLIRSNTDPNFYLNNSSDNNAVEANNSNAIDGIMSTKRQTNHRIKNYLANDFKDFFEDINHPDGYMMWLNTKDLLGSLEPPRVEVWCIAGSGLKTLGRMEYAGDFPNSPGVELYDEGDGTVTIQSAKYCTKWSEKQEQPVYYKEFNAGHMEILKDPQVVNFIERILSF